jgi:hypothetical protein
MHDLITLAASILGGDNFHDQKEASIFFPTIKLVPENGIL